MKSFDYSNFYNVFRILLKIKFVLPYLDLYLIICLPFRQINFEIISQEFLNLDEQVCTNLRSKDLSPEDPLPYVKFCNVKASWLSVSL